MSGLIGIGFASLVAFLKSSSSIISKELLDTDISYYASSWAIRFFGVPVLLVAVFLTDGIPSIDNSFYLYLGLNSVGGAVATLAYMKALSLSDISIMDPISSLSPLLLLITTPLIVNEIPSILGIIGVMVIISGVYLLKSQGASASDPLRPIESVASEPGTKYIALMIVIYSVTAPVDKLAVESSSSIFYSFSLHVCLSIILTPVLIYMSDSWRSEMFSRDALKLSSVGILSGLSSMFQMIALTYTLVVYVISIKRLGILLSTTWGVFIRGESSSILRVIGSLLIIVGTILISVSI